MSKLGAMRIRKAATVAPVLLLLVAGCGSSSDESDSGSDKFRVGLEAPLSGEQAVLGEGMLKGAELAAKQLNVESGNSGREVEIVPIDDAAEMYETFRDKRDGCIKVVLKPN